jgi:HSP20 family molecular chaperone IbpA
MSMFPRFHEFSPFFRLLDDYDRTSRSAFNTGMRELRSFSPKFDVKELKDAYELHGELPGIEQKNINIEWTDSNTLSISGRTEHHHESGERPAGFIEEGESSSHEYHKPTVEDEAGPSTEAKESAVAKTGPKEVTKAEDASKYWVSERSVGEFHRSFSFPSRVDQEAVKASLKNGILSIVVPKAKATQPRKITIE